MIKALMEADAHGKAVLIWDLGLRAADRGVVYLLEDCEASEEEWDEVVRYLELFGDSRCEDTRSDEDHQL